MIPRIFTFAAAGRHGLERRANTLRVSSGTVGLSEMAAAAVLALAPWSVEAGALVGIAYVPGYPGATVSVPVLIAGDEDFTAAQFDVHFDPSRASAHPVVLGDALTDHVVRSRVVAPGVQRTVLYSPTSAQITPTNTSLLAVLAFTVSADERVGSGPLSPQDIFLSGPGGTLVSPVTAMAGGISSSPILIDETGYAQFFLSAKAGTEYVVQASTNLEDWVDLYLVVAVGDYLDLTDEASPQYTQRFYRAVEIGPGFGLLSSPPGGATQ